MIVVWFILACLFSGAFGAAFMALLQVAKQTDIEDGVEPSLGQEDRFVFLKDADEIDDILDMDEF